MKKEMLKKRACVEVAKLAAIALIMVTVIFGGMMPPELGAVLRMGSLLVVVDYCRRVTMTLRDILAELAKEPRRKHVIVDLEKGTIKETI